VRDRATTRFSASHNKAQPFDQQNLRAIGAGNQYLARTRQDETGYRANNVNPKECLVLSSGDAEMARQASQFSIRFVERSGAFDIAT
jgi:hypothetical protein